MGGLITRRGWTLLLGVAVALLVLLVTRNPQPARPRARSDDRWAYCAPAVAHALGGIDSLLYTNSLEAFELNYRRGFRVFEVDLDVSSDGHVVAVHDWDTPSRLPGIVGQPTLDRFRNARIYGRFTALDAASLIQLLGRYRDARMILDFKADPATILLALSNATTDTTVLDRLIPIVRQGSDAARIRASFPFPSVIWTLHWVQKSDPEILRDMAQFGIGVVITNRFRISPEVLKEFRESGAVVYLSSVNTEPELRLYREWGGQGILTDFLPPDSSCLSAQ